MTPDDSRGRSVSLPDEPIDDGAETPADDLGRRMGRDARRVSRGELSEREFYEKYHDEVVEQFGFDHRPGGERE
jgi:hypothetical protein